VLFVAISSVAFGKFDEFDAKIVLRNFQSIFVVRVPVFDFSSPFTTLLHKITTSRTIKPLRRIFWNELPNQFSSTLYFDHVSSSRSHEKSKKHKQNVFLSFRPSVSPDNEAELLRIAF
jgi:hypothetical protein